MMEDEQREVKTWYADILEREKGAETLAPL
jgi:hypothetical protein